MTLNLLLLYQESVEANFFLDVQEKLLSCFLLLYCLAVEQCYLLQQVFLATVIVFTYRIVLNYAIPSQSSVSMSNSSGLCAAQRHYSTESGEGLYGQYYWNYQWPVFKNLFLKAFSYQTTLLWMIMIGISIIFSPKYQTHLWIPLLMALLSFISIQLKYYTCCDWKDFVKPMGLLTVEKAHVMLIVLLNLLLTLSLAFLMHLNPTTLEESLEAFFFAVHYLSTFLLLRALLFVSWYGVKEARSDLTIGLFLFWVFPGFLSVCVYKGVLTLSPKVKSSIAPILPKAGEAVRDFARMNQRDGLFDMWTTIFAGLGVALTGAKIWDDRQVMNKQADEIDALKSTLESQARKIKNLETINEELHSKTTTMQNEFERIKKDSYFVKPWWTYLFKKSFYFKFFKFYFFKSILI